MSTFSINGPEFVAIAVCTALVILILVSKLVNRRKPRRDCWWDADTQSRKAWFNDKKMREDEHRRY